MGELEPLPQVVNLLPSDARRSSRAISRTSSTGMVRRSAIETETDVTIAKMGSVTGVAGTALNEVARVAQAQTQLELLVPQASARFNMVADNHALDLMEQAAEHRRSLRRY